jgi:ABC-2 type transport system permease protein
VSAVGRPAVGSPSGNIYDLGYRHYEGKRRGRWYSAWSLYVDSLRGVWGFGRPMSAKAVPFIIAALYSFPALIQLAFSAQIAQAIKTDGPMMGLFTYGNYLSAMSIFLFIFCIAQAPEVVCRDQRYRVLPLYFTRAMGRFDYAFVRLASFATALFVVLILPMIALFVGDVLMGADMFVAIGDEFPRALPAIPASLLTACGLSAISIGLSSWSPRRAYAAIGLLAYLLLAEAIPAIIYTVGAEAGWAWSDKLALITPLTALTAANNWFFGLRLGPEYPATMGADAYVPAALLSVVVFTSILLFRYRRIAA